MREELDKKGEVKKTTPKKKHRRPKRYFLLVATLHCCCCSSHNSALNRCHLHLDFRQEGREIWLLLPGSVISLWWSQPLSNPPPPHIINGKGGVKWHWAYAYVLMYIKNNDFWEHFMNNQYRKI